MNIQISDHAYTVLTEAARLRGTTPEALIESLAEQLPVGFAKDEDEFYRAMGMNDTQIAQIKADAQSLPDDPEW